VEESLRGTYFASAIGTGKSVADLGCRDGAMARAYMHGNDVVGVDIDRQALDRARARGLETVWADLNEPLPLEGGAFDAVVVGEVLEHLPAPGALLDQAVRLLKPSGVLVGSVPNSFRLKNRMRFLRGDPVEPDPTHLQHFSLDGLREDLTTRFEIVRIRLAASRFLRLSPRLFANTLLFTGERPLASRPVAHGVPFIPDGTRDTQAFGLRPTQGDRD